jgi:SNF2 family DNA or RNA helicase
MDVKEFKDAETAYLRMKQRALGKAMGQVLHPRRKEMFIKLYEQNKDEIIDMIHNATKKTVIFSTTLDVVKYISDDLSKNGVKNVKIIGETKDRMTLIQDFKNNDEIEVLVATSQTLSTGVTLTEANQMLFFGTPWRSADYDQCCDRIYRIGQNTDVDIYNILLETGDKLNLSTRMNDILECFDEMFNSMIGDEK